MTKAQDRKWQVRDHSKADAVFYPFTHDGEPMGGTDEIFYTTPGGDARIVRSLEYYNGEHFYAIITPGGGTSLRATSWGIVGEYLPRSAWPEEIPNGLSGDRVLDPEVAAWMAEMRAKDQAEFDFFDQFEPTSGSASR